uniref:(California timema) hypothetical protein n=1 Tax=Timema californicum TaxID=61474 RepID=A0A7R9P4X9_TIMCA|nr:unnamed protein product [Timema californicum]
MHDPTTAPITRGAAVAQASRTNVHYSGHTQDVCTVLFEGGAVLQHVDESPSQVCQLLRGNLLHLIRLCGKYCWRICTIPTATRMDRLFDVGVVKVSTHHNGSFQHFNTMLRLHCNGSAQLQLNTSQEFGPKWSQPRPRVTYSSTDGLLYGAHSSSRRGTGEGSARGRRTFYIILAKSGSYHLLLVFSLKLGGLSMVVVVAVSSEQPRYDTAYACEGKTLKIECNEGEIIHLIRANYGRFSITICNDHGNTEWSVNCMSPKSLRVLHTNRNQKLLWSKSVLFHCGRGNHHQRGVESGLALVRVVPPLVESVIVCELRSAPFSKAGVFSLSDRSSLREQCPDRLGWPQIGIFGWGDPFFCYAITLVCRVLAPPACLIQCLRRLDELHIFASTFGTPTKLENYTLVNNSTLVLDYTPSPSITWLQENELVLCSPTSARNLYWNWTQAGEVNVQPCPGGATGLARWRCVVLKPLTMSSPPTVSWLPDTPDLSECRSLWLTNLESRVEEGDSIISISNDLSQVTSSKTLYGGDMMTTTKIIKKMAQKMAQDIQTFPDPRQREAIVTELLHGVVVTGSNLLDSSQHPSWLDLSHKEQMRVATSLLMGLEENAFLLADTVIREKTVIQNVKNILLSVRVVETRNVGTEQFPSPTTYEHWQDSQDWLQIPRGALLENSEGGLVRLVFVAFNRLEEILQPHSDPSTVDVIGENGELATALVVLNSTAEDGEIEVRISVG